MRQWSSTRANELQPFQQRDEAGSAILEEEQVAQ